MTISTATTPAIRSTSAHRPLVDTAVERLALGMLRWSDHRAEAAAVRPVFDRADRTAAFVPAASRSVDSGRTARFF